MENLSDLLGPIQGTDFRDLLGPPPKKNRGKRKRKGKRDWGSGKPYEPLERPSDPQKGAIWDLRAKANRAGTLGKLCLMCDVKLKLSKGRPRIICGKPPCFRAMRNAYRREYDKAHPERS